MEQENLLRPNAEVVRTGVGPNRLVSGPFNSDPPSQSLLPPGYVPPTPAPNPAREAGSNPALLAGSRHPRAKGEAEPPEGRADPRFPPGEEGFDEAEYVLASVRGGKKRFKRAVLWEVVRSLRVPDDLPLLNQSLPQARQSLSQIRHSHHQLAQLIATGSEQNECSRITGYAPQYISILKTDPTFKELVEYYASQREMVYIDAIERMRSLGINTLEELQIRLEEDPSQFTNRELFEQAELLLIKPMAATRNLMPPAGQGAAGGTGVNVQVNFIQPPNHSEAPKQPDIIDLKPIQPVRG